MTVQFMFCKVLSGVVNLIPTGYNFTETQIGAGNLRKAIRWTER